MRSKGLAKASESPPCPGCGKQMSLLSMTATTMFPDDPPSAYFTCDCRWSVTLAWPNNAPAAADISR